MNEHDQAPRKKKKKKKAGFASAQPIARDVTRPSAPLERHFTSTHVVLALVAGLGLGATGGYFGSKQSATGGSSATAGAPASAVNLPLAAWSPREGPQHAKVTIVEFSDFQ
jgi:hypothetical protein